MTTSEPCIPEWCDPDDLPEHSTTCPNHLVDEPVTKGRLVELCETAASHAIDAYVIMTELDEPWSPDDAKDIAVSEVNEATTCYVGIGSCGRGWCKHS